MLNFFAEHPGQSFSLTDLVRTLKLSRATCHGLLVGLVEARYLYKTSDKSYVLGPALVSISEIAKSHFSPLQITQPEMRALADEYDGICTAAFRDGTGAVVRARAAAVSHLGYTVPRDIRLHLPPELAGIFFVFSPPTEVAQWLSELDPLPSAKQREAMAAGIEFIRKHGFQFSILNKVKDMKGLAQDGGRGREHAKLHMLPLTDLDPKRSYEIGVIQAPVYGRRNVAFVLNLQGFNGPRTGMEVAEIGARLIEACERISTFVGNVPD